MEAFNRFRMSRAPGKFYHIFHPSAYVITLPYMIIKQIQFKHERPFWRAPIATMMLRRQQSCLAGCLSHILRGVNMIFLFSSWALIEIDPINWALSVVRVPIADSAWALLIQFASVIALPFIIYNECFVKGVCVHFSNVFQNDGFGISIENEW